MSAVQITGIYIFLYSRSMDKEYRSLKNPEEPFFAGVLDAETLGEILQNPQSDLSKMVAQCSALEIRYDLLLAAGYPKESLGGIAGRIRSAFPDALLIGTFRLERDGGKFPDARAMERAEYICDILTSDVFPDYLDIETEEFVRLEGRIFEIWNDERVCEKRKGFWTMRNGHRFYQRDFPVFDNLPKKVLISHHDFQKVPTLDELESLRKCAIGAECAGLKIACMSHSPGDFDRIYPWISSACDFELFSCFAMGKSGEESRVKSLLFGANLTYCSLGASVAPGQIPVEDARNAYRKLVPNG